MVDQPFLLNSTLQDRLKKISLAQPEQFLFVSVKKQQLFYVNKGVVLSCYIISTSRYGIGNQEGSFKTPLGIHRITEKIGAGTPAGRIFRDRKDTEVDWHEGIDQENLILTRILRLEGMELGFNRGGSVDSFDRYIYIHGTNKEEMIGTPLSHGCVCMKNSDIISLFDQVKEGTLVFID